MENRCPPDRVKRCVTPRDLRTLATIRPPCSIRGAAYGLHQSPAASASRPGGGGKAPNWAPLAENQIVMLANGSPAGAFGASPRAGQDPRAGECPGRDSNPQAPEGAAPFKGAAFASFATRARPMVARRGGPNIKIRTKKRGGTA